MERGCSRYPMLPASQPPQYHRPGPTARVPKLAYRWRRPETTGCRGPGVSIILVAGAQICIAIGPHCTCKRLSRTRLAHKGRVPRFQGVAIVAVAFRGKAERGRLVPKITAIGPRRAAVSVAVTRAMATAARSQMEPS